MLGMKLLEEIGSGMARQWVDRILSPSLIFWFGGFLSYLTEHKGTPILSALHELDFDAQVFIVVAVMIVTALSSIVIEDIQFSALRFMEGYWPPFLGELSRMRIDAIKVRLKRKENEWTALAQRFETLTGTELQDYMRLDGELASYPVLKRLMPTRLGNVLRTAEDYSWNRYGLAIGVLWPRLWLVMPKEARREISHARARLDGAVRLCLWSILFLIWSVWAWWWVVPVSILGMIAGYLKTHKAAGIFGELICTSFDLYRAEIYKSLRWPLPRNAEEEYKAGKKLTNYLWRGSHEKALIFTAYP